MYKSVIPKKYSWIGTFVFFAPFIFSLLNPQSVHAATTYYVSPQGNDSNSGAQSSPFLTIQKAVNSVVPGDKVIVGDGIYAGAELSKGGTAGNWVTIQSENKGGAKVVSSQALNTHGFYFYPSANFINVMDFDVSGGQSAFLIDEGGHDLNFKGNNIHDVGRFCSDTGVGLVGVYMESATNITIEGNTFQNIGRFSPGENGCQPTNEYYKNHDHGVYINGSNAVLVKNNVFIDFNHGWAIQLYSSSGQTSTNVKIFNNTFAFDNPNKSGHIILSGKMNAVQIKNNIFYQAKNSALDFFEPDTSNVTVENNLSDTAMSTLTHSGVTYSNNTENTNPLMVSPAASEFSLQVTSPAVDGGLALNDVPVDHKGISRPQGAGYDVGAFERAGVVQSPTPTPSPAQCLPADINEDGVVNVFDYSILAGQFLKKPVGVLRADINADGVVNLKDYGELVFYLFDEKPC